MRCSSLRLPHPAQLLVTRLWAAARQRWRCILGAQVAVTVGVAWHLRFGLDDAFISFVYARSLVRGQGLTWFGDHVEGYTNFLWVLWSACGIALGLEPLPWAWLGSLGALAATLLITFDLVRQISGSRAAGLAALAVLGVNFSFLAYGTSGLETMLQTALVTFLVREVERYSRERPSVLALVRFSCVGAALLATRLDSAVPVAVSAAFAIRGLVSRRERPMAYVALLLPMALVTTLWLLWKLWYYGELLPNTFYAKADGTWATVLRGLRHAGRFLHAYWLWPVALLAALLVGVQRRFAELARLGAALTAWYGYVIVVGGDFMEYRFFVPLLPVLAAILAAVFVRPIHPRSSGEAQLIALVLVLGFASVRHATTFRRTRDFSLDSIHSLGTFYGAVPDGDWSALGLALRAALGGTGAVLACDGAGAIPYYSELYTVDQLGLEDPWVARHGLRPPSTYARPGHQRFAPLEYLVSRHVNFVIGTPMVLRRGALRWQDPKRVLEIWSVLALGPVARTQPHLLLVGAPVRGDYELVVWYLEPTPELTRRIRAAGWSWYEIGGTRPIPGVAK